MDENDGCLTDHKDLEIIILTGNH